MLTPIVNEHYNITHIFFENAAQPISLLYNDPFEHKLKNSSHLLLSSRVLLIEFIIVTLSIPCRSESKTFCHVSIA